MSIGSEMLAEYAFEIDYPYGIPNSKNPIWKTARGEAIPVRNMELDHIWHCMDMVGQDDPWWGIFAEETRRRLDAHF